LKIISNFEKNTIRAFLKLSSNSIASLQIYNTYGTLVNDVFCNKALANGEYNYDIRTLSMVKGMYISKLTVNGEVFSTKFIYQ